MGDRQNQWADQWGYPIMWKVWISSCYPSSKPFLLGVLSSTMMWLKTSFTHIGGHQAFHSICYPANFEALVNWLVLLLSSQMKPGLSRTGEDYTGFLAYKIGQRLLREGYHWAITVVTTSAFEDSKINDLESLRVNKKSDVLDAELN